MSSLRPHAFAAALLFGLLVPSSCRQHAGEKAGSGSAAPAWGLDARPVALSCLAPDGAEEPLVEDGTSPVIGFHVLNDAQLDAPIEISAQSGQTFIAEQKGLLRRLEKNGSTSVILDIQGRVTTGYDQGLVSFAFHPAFPAKPYVYLSYTAPPATLANAEFESVIARFQTFDSGITFDPASEKRVLAWAHPSGSTNHNNGCVRFGPDGLLYIGSGDAAVAWELQYQAAQRPEHLLGKILRLDVDSKDPYAIPPGNAFANGGGAPEIYAMGLRNPWRFNFDPKSGRLWAGDVGHSTWEEIDEIVAGGNYGWGNREGFVCFASGATCEGNYVDPLWVHQHPDANAIVGGVFYWGKGVPKLTGMYVYADAMTSNFWAVKIDGEKKPVRLDLSLQRMRPVSLRLDENGEMLFAGYNGYVARITPANAAADLSLKKTGCVDGIDARVPAPGLFHYDVNIPQPLDPGWSQDRWLSVPKDASLAASTDGRLALPRRAVAMKTLSAEGRRVETQTLSLLADGSWRADTYAWNDQGADAQLAVEAVDVTLPSGRVYTVNPKSCANCHSESQGMTAGLNLAQLDRGGVDYGGGRTGNPLATLRHLGMILP
jgi:glucose/arabinose dehydrogenase